MATRPHVERLHLQCPIMKGHVYRTLQGRTYIYRTPCYNPHTSCPQGKVSLNSAPSSLSVVLIQSKSTPKIKQNKISAVPKIPPHGMREQVPASTAAMVAMDTGLQPIGGWGQRWRTGGGGRGHRNGGRGTAT